MHQAVTALVSNPTAPPTAQARNGFKKTTLKGPIEGKLKPRGSTGGMHFPRSISFGALYLSQHIEYRFPAQAYESRSETPKSGSISDTGRQG